MPYVRKTSEAIEIEFPDLKGCVSFGHSWDDAIENATDVLAGWLAHAESQFIKEPSTYDELKRNFTAENLIPIAVDEKIMQAYKRRIPTSPVRPSRKTKQRSRALQY